MQRMGDIHCWVRDGMGGVRPHFPPLAFPLKSASMTRASPAQKSGPAPRPCPRGSRASSFSHAGHRHTVSSTSSNAGQRPVRAHSRVWVVAADSPLHSGHTSEWPQEAFPAGRHTPAAREQYNRSGTTHARRHGSPIPAPHWVRKRWCTRAHFENDRIWDPRRMVHPPSATASAM